MSGNEIEETSQRRRGSRALPGFVPKCSAFAVAGWAFLFISITQPGASHPQLHAQQVAIQAPPATAGNTPGNLPEGPEQIQYPVAKVIPEPGDTELVKMDSATQAEADGKYTLDGNVVILYQDYKVEADHVEYDSNTHELTANGHLVLTGGPRDEHIVASHGTMNLETQTGRFYDVNGSVGMKPATKPTAGDVTDTLGKRMSYTNTNPFLFTGRVVVKTGPQDYEVFDGTVTSCQLPKPDWLLSGSHFSIDGEKARAKNSIFHLLNIPLLYLPYVTHPVDAEDRQSGILIPVFSPSSSKGLIVGEQIYFVLNRSMDMTVGAEYYENVGWGQNATFRAKGQGNDFITAHYTGVLDRQPPGPTNQGGEDAIFSGRHDIDTKTRVAATVEYLSSYIFREAFTENFNQAVTSDVVSTLYATHESDGTEVALEADRYQGIKVVQSLTADGQQVRIFHAPAVMLSTTDHSIAGTNVQWSVEGSIAGLKRTQPNFGTPGIVERYDLHPEIAWPLHFAGWNLRPSLAARETVYSRSRVVPYVPGAPPAESSAALSRPALEAGVELRPPVLERTFDLHGKLEQLFGAQVKHTIEPSLTYRYTTGVDNFLAVLRFDAVDVMANTNEAEYGLTQRLFLRPRKHSSCETEAVRKSPGLDADDSSDVQNLDEGLGTTGRQDAQPKEKAHCPNEERISWKLSQKYFINQTFGAAVIDGRRNIFDSTLAFSGVAFLTEPRETSPILSRMRIRTTAKTDFEWDFDYDVGASKFTSNNVFIDLHQGAAFGALSYARLDAPGRFYTQGTSQSVSNFNQMRFLIGYGMPTRPGLSVAANAGIDLDAGLVTTTTAATTTTPAVTTTAPESLLQYAALQASYNWNCCGISLEYRKYELGSVRNEGVYRFNFTLVNIGTAGNLKRAERLF